jgi:GT2 family glycosyltransferase
LEFIKLENEGRKSGDKFMIVFVILHYRNISDTLECIESIKKLNIKNYKIIVVENGSLDSTTNELKKVQNIDVIYNEENFGFAKGNNIGIRYANQEFNPDYYVVINNDIIIKQHNFAEEIIKMGESFNFDVMGPTILAKNNVNQNPNFQVLSSSKDILKHILRLNVVRILIDLKLYSIMKKFMPNKKISIQQKEEMDSILHNVPLHGAALIFSRNYVERYSEPFDESTFLYAEEEFLNYRRERDKLNFIYAPNITVYHKEDASLNHLFTSNELKTKFVIKNSSNSLGKLLLIRIKDNLSR